MTDIFFPLWRWRVFLLGVDLSLSPSLEFQCEYQLHGCMQPPPPFL